MDTPTPEVVELEEQHTVAVRGTVEIPELPKFFAKAFTAAVAAIEEAGAEIAGPPFGYYPAMPNEGTVLIEAGFPVSQPVGLAGEVHDLVLPSGRAVIAWHIGPYEAMEGTYNALRAWMFEAELRPAKGVWECYTSDPAVEPDPSKWRTKIVWPII